MTREQAAIFAHLEAAKSLLSLEDFVICLAVTFSVIFGGMMELAAISIAGIVSPEKKGLSRLAKD